MIKICRGGIDGCHERRRGITILVGHDCHIELATALGFRIHPVRTIWLRVLVPYQSRVMNVIPQSCMRSAWRRITAGDVWS